MNAAVLNPEHLVPEGSSGFAHSRLRRNSGHSSCAATTIASFALAAPVVDWLLDEGHPLPCAVQEALVAEAAAADEESVDDVSFASLDPEAQRLVLESIMAGFSDDEDFDEDGSTVLTEQLRADLLQEEGGQILDDAGMGPDSGDGHERERYIPRDGEDAASDGCSHSEDDTAVDGSTTVAANNAAAPTAGVLDAAVPLDNVVASGSGRGAPMDGADSSWTVDSDDDELEAASADWEERDPAAVAACSAAAGSWPRVIRCTARSPRTRFPTCLH